MSEKIASPKLMTDQSSTLDIEYRTQSTLEIGTATLKIKVKRRGLATESVSAEIEAPLIDNALPAPAIIAVNNRARKVFSVLFHNPMQDFSPGEIPWSEFLYALSSVGFAVEKQQGSAWLFTPSIPGNRPIIFHEPHPSNKIPIHQAQRHGRRLQRVYDWTNETFVTAKSPRLS